MAGAGGEEVGRISIRVVPDTDRFREDLERDLRKAEKGAKVEVPVAADTSRFRREIQAATRKLPDAEIDVKANVDRFGTRMVAEMSAAMAKLEKKIPLTSAGERFRRDIEGAAAQLRAAIGQKIPLDLELAAGQRSKILGEVEALKQLASETPMKLKIDPEMDYRLHKRLADLQASLANDRHRQQMLAWKDELRHMKMREDETRKFIDKYTRANPKIELKLDPEFDYKLRQRLSKIKPRIPVELDVDVKRGFLDRIAGAMDKIRPPSFGSGINPTGWAVILAGIAAAAPLVMGLLGSITTAVLSIPGMISAVMVPIGAMALGLNGLKRAAERLKTPFENLKSIMSTAVENQFGPIFDQLGGVFPMLERSLPQVTQGLADMAKSALDVVTSDEGMSKIERTIGNIAQALKDAAPGIGDFTSGLLDLAENFTKRLPDVSKWFNETGKSFKDWAEDFTKVGADGTSKFDRALSGLGDTLKLLGGGLVELGGKALDFMNDPEKIKAFKTEVDGLVNSLLTLADVLNGISKLMGKIPGFSDGEANSPMDFAPFQIQLIKDQLGKVDWSGVWNNLKTSASAAFSGIVSSAGTTVSGIVSAFTGLPVLLAGVFASVVATAANVVGQIVAQFSQLPGQVAGIWNGLVGLAANIFSSVVSTAATVIPQIVTTFVTVGGQVLAEVSSWPGRIVGALGDLAGQLRDAGARAGQALVQGLAGAIAGGVSAVAGAVGQLMSAARNLIPNSPAKEGPFSGSGWKAVTGFGDTIGDAMASGIPAQERKIVSLATQLMQAIKDVFGSAEGLTLNFNLGGSSALSGLGGTASALTSNIENLNTQLGETRSITDGIGSSMTELGGVMDGNLKKQLQALKVQSSELELRRQELQNQKNLTTDKGLKQDLQRQINEIDLMRDKLALQRDQLNLQKETTASADESYSIFEKTVRSMYDAAKSVIGVQQQQLYSDLGISGQGALPQLIEQGVALGEHFVFNVSSVDEAMSIKDREESKKSLSVIGR
ncbi:putative tape measure protein [Mycobacterium phage PP]|uniref:Putative tape measure protein n=1 Tax=Mycobacterium phage PP TaxID=2077134 RepID=A0A2Z5XVE9_9CAUD|nr:putative tape measure protein [Mycobacterium phage PP]BBC53829.1 putative tape measure protein [Mycobacterium phage PP]